MKNAALPRIKRISPYLCSFFLLASLAISFSSVLAQQLQLSLADILTGLRSKKVTLIDRNRLLVDAVRKRGVTFTLTPEIEKELKITGADDQLIEAVRQKSVVIKASLTASPKPVSIPAASPTPAPTPDFTFYQNRANANFVKGSYDLALADYNKVIELNPKDSSIYFSRAMAYYNKKSYDLAIADYDKAIELNPKDPTSFFNRAELYEKTGNTQKAMADYQKTVELDGSNETAKNNLKRLQAEQAKNSQSVTTTPQSPKTGVTSPTVAAPSEPKVVELGMLNNLALSLAMPIYPEFARKTAMQGKVMVRVILDEKGKVISAKGINGPKLLQGAAEDAVRKSKFNPTLSENQPVKATGIIVYNFVY